ncbi:MAG: UvrD-helicase domain-containing protein [Terracidiphilus sp.]
MPSPRPSPPDQPQRVAALDPARSILVQAPAGSGKTDLLTRRFLRLLAEVDDPSHIVAITFTRAATAEMRHRVLYELDAASEESATSSADETHAEPPEDSLSMRVLARRALARSRRLNWKLLDLPSQLRIDTIDAFCREIALQQPLLSGLGGRLEHSPQPHELYRRAARRTLFELDSSGKDLADAIRLLLLWHDNNFAELEDLLVKMLSDRDRWMHEFVFRTDPDWDALRASLEQPFSNAIHSAIFHLDSLFQQIPHAQDEILSLARFACRNEGGEPFQPLAELAEFPASPFSVPEDLEEARQAWLTAAKLLLTNNDGFRQRIDKSLGFPADRKNEKARLLSLIKSLAAVPGLQSALADLRELPSARYSDEEWSVVRASFTLLRSAAAELLTVFAETGHVDYTQVAQIARQVLLDENRQPTEVAIALADNIHHLLVDEFQDTSRSQHRLLGSLVAAWPDQAGRTLFVVGDPMQSIYSFREADAELFPQVRDRGLNLPNADELPLDPVRLSANFRTDPSLVTNLNSFFTQVFAENDGSGITFEEALPVRESGPLPLPRCHLHCAFMPNSQSGNSTLGKEPTAQRRAVAQQSQIESMLDVIRGHIPLVDEALAGGAKWRIAVLARAKKHLAPLALVLRKAGIPFRAVELEDLTARPEILDALALARALLNPQDRVAWLGLLRAPWCGLSLADLHTLAGDPESANRSIPDLLSERQALLTPPGQTAVRRLTRALDSEPALRNAQPLATLGTRLQQLWLRLGGAACVNATALANLHLLWSCLDALPAGESDLLGPALDAALKSLTALPDEAASSDSGVQLMTIHKSKGLEFEVVLIPELQAGTGGKVSRKLLSWLERGLATPTPEGEITEFLVAPLHAKGTQSGSARAFVERVSRKREDQESRRLLYVAATRAREELHLFARPEYTFKAAEPQLATPSKTLLATAWPALEEETRVQFAEAQSSLAIPDLDVTHTLAAVSASQSASADCSSAPRPALLRRLPADFELPPLAASGATATDLTPFAADAPLADAPLFDRHEGGLPTRTLGLAVHALFQQLAHFRATLDLSAALESIQTLRPRLIAQARATGLTLAQANSSTALAFQLAAQAAADPIAQWVLAPHPGAAAEAAWTGLVAGSLRTVRVDRLFRAGPEPLASGDDFWWIVDYKTAHADALNPAQTLPELRAQFAPQLQAYAAVLRLLHGEAAQLRAALYYPRLLKLDWWEIS